MENNKRLDYMVSRIIPFIGMGIFIVFMVVALIFLSSLLLIGSMIGLILFFIAYIRSKFFNKRKKQMLKAYRKGQTYEHKD